MGYRYDHAPASPSRLPALSGCDYVQETRELNTKGTRLTDHFGLAVRLAVTPTGRLLTSVPITAASEPEQSPTLF